MRVRAKFRLLLRAGGYRSVDMDKAETLGSLTVRIEW
jgi:hypothetical protein